MLSAIYKIPDGKLLRVSLLRNEAGNIAEVKLNGDFFAHPEDGIERLEGALVGLPLMESDLVDVIATFLASDSVQLFGLHPAGIARGLMMCVEQI